MSLDAAADTSFSEALSGLDNEPLREEIQKLWDRLLAKHETRRELMERELAYEQSSLLLMVLSAQRDQDDAKAARNAK